MPMTGNQYSFTAKVGFEYETFHPDIYVNGYVSKQYIASADTLFTLPSYGYMHYEDANSNPAGLLDFNREKEIAYRDTWGRGTDSFMAMIYECLILMNYLLADDGSIFVHCDWRVSPLLRMAMGEIFGPDSFQNEIYWYYYNKLHGATKQVFPRATDTILY